MIVSKQAFMKQADRNPNRDGFEAGLIVQDKNDAIIDREGSFHLKTDKILGGWCKVYRKDFRVPVTARVLLSEYDKGRSTWIAIKATMIRKVAVAQAHREAFPEEYQGIYMAEELGQDNGTMKQADAEVINDPREKTIEVELTSGQIINTAGISGYTLNAIQELTGDNDLAMKDMSFFLKGREAESIVNLTEDEGEELKALLMDKYAEPEPEQEPKPEPEIESDDIDGLADLEEKEPGKLFKD